jgi:hypothetical protein
MGIVRWLTGQMQGMGQHNQMLVIVCRTALTMAEVLTIILCNLPSYLIRLSKHDIRRICRLGFAQSAGALMILQG